MYCTNCGEEIKNNQGYCTKCGAGNRKTTDVCSNCGRPLVAGAGICINCGADVKKITSLDKYGNVTMALICFFLGWCGVHNFMMGEAKKGVMKIVFSLLCGLGTIFVLIDFFKLITNNYTVDPDKYI